MSITAPTGFASAAAVSPAESFQFCQAVTRQQAKNFYYGLKLLPEPRRSAMFALYAYMRAVDDIADGQAGRPVSERNKSLESWTQQTRDALAGKIPGSSPLWPAFIDMTRRYGVPGYVFEEVIAGQKQDLDGPVFEDFEPLRQYCYRVAGVVGVASIHVFGFTGGDETIELAVRRGVAFQLTNILRDLREDALRGRVYLPRKELREAGVADQDLLIGKSGALFVDLMRRQIDRARSYYADSSQLESRVEPASRPTLSAMTDIYRGLLEKISADPARVLKRRVSLSALSKLRIAWRAARSR
jgi:15-cis-phytoene synthase